MMTIPPRRNLTLGTGKIAFSHFNVEEFVESTTTQVIVLIDNPNGRVET